MAEVHEWLNSVGVVAAVVVSGYFGWYSNRLKSESLLVSGSPTTACSVKVGAAESALCWSVIIANGSENPLSIIQANWKRILPSGATAVLGFNFLTPEGEPLPFPVNLDGGKGTKIIVRAILLVSSDVADVTRTIGENSPQPPQPQSLRDVQLRIASAGLDVLGNKVNPVKDGKNVIGWRWEAPFRTEVFLLTLKTGRGGAFGTTLNYPSPTNNWGPD